MGAGRKTQTTTYDSANRQGARGPPPQYKKLDRDELGGVIFGATKDTINECLTKNIFGLPYNHISYVQNIVPGMPLFLFNYSDRKLHGIFEATSEGELHIDPNAWSRDGRTETSYPAQVRVKYREKCTPLHEAVFGPAIEENYYSNVHFMFELTQDQAATLCSLFTARNPARPATAPVPQQTVASSHAAAWAGASAGQGDGAWGTAPPANAWGAGPPPARPDTASSSKPPLPAWQSGPAAPSSNGGGSASTSSGLPADGGAAAEAERRRQQSERDREAARVREEEARAAAERQARAEAKMRATAAEEEERRRLEEAAAERRRSEERAERERQVLEKLKKVSVNGPSANGAAAEPGDAGAGVNGPKEWEREANARAEAEQAALTEERMRLFDGSRPLEAAVKETVQKNLELCAAAISHMRQEALKSKKLAEEMTSGDAQMAELKEVRAENQRLARSQATMQRRMDELQAQMETLRQSVVDLLSGSHVAANPAPSRSPPRAQEVYLMGGFNGSEWLGSVDRYRPLRDEWEAVAPMSAKRSYAASAVLDGMVYVFGGGEGQLWYDTAERYDRASNSWATLSKMKIKRGSLGGAAVQGKIYAVGGGNGVNNLNDVEMYDPGADRWLSAPPMLDKRFCVAAAEMHNSLYALGGFDGQQYLPTMERFDPREGYWVRAPSMSTKRGSLSAAVYNNSLFALGGFDGNVFLNTVETYEPRMNKWKPVPPMHTQRAYGASMVVDNALYFIGGLDGALHVDSVERYTPDAGWQVVKMRSNSSKRSFLALAVL